MASVTKNDDGKNAMADEETTDNGGGDEVSSLPAKVTGAEGKSPRRDVVVAGGADKRSPGFFTIYKSGQGYWTRMGTVAGAALIAILTAAFLYDQCSVWIQKKITTNGEVRSVPNTPVVIGVVVAFLSVYSFLVYRLVNRPKVVDFLIATDSEMKKVNWTTRAELIGSTKVVIVFMFLIAVILFFFDTLFAEIFHLIGVLLIGPFQ